jgi:hypothetical protein
MKTFTLLIASLMLVATGALAEMVTVEFIGTVEYNQVNQGIFAGVSGGDAVHASFTVDSETWLPSPGGFGVRGYPIDLASFELTIGSVGPVALVMPQPNGETTYFSLRNADPVADGFFISNQLDWDYVLPKLNVPGGLDPYFTFHWSVGYTEDTFSSLDILDAIGSYDYTGLTNFYTVIADSFADPIGLEFVQTIISASIVDTQSTTMSSIKAMYR